MRDLYIASCAVDGGIYRYKMADDGSITFCDKTDADRPMFLAKANNKLYALLRAPFGSGESGMEVFDIDDDGKLNTTGEIYPTRGEVACHLWVEDEDVYAVNYVSGSVIKFPNKVDVHEGQGPNKIRQDKAHTHYTRVTPDKKYVCVTDLGLDTIFFYNRELELKFKVKVPEGHGARHIEFSEDGKYMYCVNELKATVSVFAYDGENTKLLGTYNTLPEDFKGDNTAAAIRLSGEYLYVSNRGYDGVTALRINGEGLIPESYTKLGKHPRDINIFGDILVSTNMQEDSVTFYKVCGKEITKLDTEIRDIKEPLCVI